MLQVRHRRNDVSLLFEAWAMMLRARPNTSLTSQNLPPTGWLIAIDAMTTARPGSALCGGAAAA